MSDADRFIVEVREDVTEALTEHAGHVYVSPPQDREQALELVAVLLGRPLSTNGDVEEMWRQAIAGGQRSVLLRRVASRPSVSDMLPRDVGIASFSDQV